MSWRRRLRALWPFGAPDTRHEADAALEAAEQSLRRAVEDRRTASAVRAEAEVWEQQIRDHNSANRYDDFLLRVMRGHS
jgi:hypothetical protein